MDDVCAVSALTNCGGFPKAWSASDISALGLVVDRSRAVARRDRLLQEYPHDAHAECAVWAVWRKDDVA